MYMSKQLCNISIGLHCDSLAVMTGYMILMDIYNYRNLNKLTVYKLLKSLNNCYMIIYDLRNMHRKYIMILLV